MKKTIFVTALSLLLSTATCQASESEKMFNDVAYGGAVGALVGFGALLLSTSPKENLDYISKGAGVGIILGAAYGIFDNTTALIISEDGDVSLNAPMPQLFINGKDISLNTNIIAGTF